MERLRKKQYRKRERRNAKGEMGRAEGETGAWGKLRVKSCGMHAVAGGETGCNHEMHEMHEMHEKENRTKKGFRFRDISCIPWFGF